MSSNGKEQFQIQQNFRGSNTGGSFTTAVWNSFLSSLEKSNSCKFRIILDDTTYHHVTISKKRFVQAKSHLEYKEKGNKGMPWFVRLIMSRLTRFLTVCKLPYLFGYKTGFTFSRMTTNN